MAVVGTFQAGAIGVQLTGSNRLRNMRAVNLKPY